MDLEVATMEDMDMDMDLHRDNIFFSIERYFVVVWRGVVWYDTALRCSDLRLGCVLLCLALRWCLCWKGRRSMTELAVPVPCRALRSELSAALSSADLLLCERIAACWP
jgi:hypothetical protein